MNCNVQYNELCVPVRTTGGLWTVQYCTPNSAVLHATVHIPPVVLTGTQSSVYSTLQFIFHQLFWIIRRVRTTGGIWTVECGTTNSAYHSQNTWWNMNCSVLCNQICVPVRTTGGIWTVAYYTTNSSYQSELYFTVHIPPVVLTGTQSSVYSTLQFIFHQLFWLVRRVRCIVRYSSYSTSCSDWYTIQNNWWNMNCRVLYTELCVPVRTTGGIWTVECCTPNSAYQSEELVEYELQRAVQRTLRKVRCTVLHSSYSTSCSDWYAEFDVLHVTALIPPDVLTGTQRSGQLVEYEL
jgi:hypothetical protein